MYIQECIRIQWKSEYLATTNGLNEVCINFTIIQLTDLQMDQQSIMKTMQVHHLSDTDASI